MLFFKKYYVNTTEKVDVISITPDLKYAIRDSQAPEGLLTAIVPQPGAGLTIMMSVEEAIEELKTVLDVFATEAGKIKDKLKRERDLGPIIQSALLGRSVHIPFQDAKLLIDPYDEVLLLDFEKKGGRREFIVQVLSEAPCPSKQQAAPRGKPLGKVGGKR